mgnify:FL=1
MYIINMIKKGVSKKEFKKSLNFIPSVAKNVTIRMQIADVEGFKKKAGKNGMPYQTLINSVLHRYLTGAIKITDPM